MWLVGGEVEEIREGVAELLQPGGHDGAGVLAGDDGRSLGAVVGVDDGHAVGLDPLSGSLEGGGEGVVLGDIAIDAHEEHVGEGAHQLALGRLRADAHVAPQVGEGAQRAKHGGDTFVGAEVLVSVERDDGGRGARRRELEYAEARGALGAVVVHEDAEGEARVVDEGHEGHVGRLPLGILGFDEVDDGFEIVRDAIGVGECLVKREGRGGGRASGCRRR
mmetsp:Transcript_46760/g.123131  ORF Transcript_46760/g.123131 Transcript_46760/m.123131 type:complete len:220 (-) Transcript_46760:2849-3508(-)